MFTLQIESPHLPDVVLTALRTRAGEWRESEIPDELTRYGMLSVECRPTTDGCVLRYDPPSYGTRGTGRQLQAEATVSPSGSGTRVSIRLRYALQVHVFVLGGFGFMLASIVGMLAIGPRALLVLLLPLVGMMLTLLMALVENRSLSQPLDAAGSYLVQRITDAVTSAGHASASPDTLPLSSSEAAAKAKRLREGPQS
ncbi:MAG TPA: hypothetical protein VFK13_08665 [Gemmatimonadaceae bacterium]|nr:hypothetical protein [Gemmatimonadaceae bacterium]